MDIYKIFKFIEEKTGKPIPLKYKLLFAPETIIDKDLYVKGGLYLNSTKITSLPEGLKVAGSLDLCYSGIRSLPKGLEVGESLYLSNTKITSLPNDLKVRYCIVVDRGKENYFQKNFPKFADQII